MQSAKQPGMALHSRRLRLPRQQTFSRTCRSTAISAPLDTSVHWVVPLLCVALLVPSRGRLAIKTSLRASHASQDLRALKRA